ncbi:MAG TPA: nucleotide exchange factor GrpE [Rubrobacteraceae bacterium]|nr:nucleotide exchange factor GrpE [Rubrobacteraceae bacterium]
MSSEERNRDPDPREPQEETTSEPAGGPEDPGSVESAAAEDAEVVEDPEIVEEPEVEVVGTDVVEEEPGVAEEETAAIAEELELTRRERDEYLSALQRLKAEFENSRKRHERELTRVRETASEKLVAELLPVLDNLDRALESEGDIREGVRATRDHFADVLGEAGLAPVTSDGQHFDPNVHEAVMGQPSEEHEEGIILQTFERGYLLNGKPIRPAKVVVARQV